MEFIKKKMLIIDLIIALEPPFDKFFDIASDKLLDEKIAVLTALKGGKQIKDIPDFYKVLELLPEEGTHWD